MTKPNAAAFKRVSDQLERGDQLTFNMMGDIFGNPFWEMVVLSLLDAQDAARAIQLATLRIRMGEQVDDDDLDDEEPS